MTSYWCRCAPTSIPRHFDEVCQLVWIKIPFLPISIKQESYYTGLLAFTGLTVPMFLTLLVHHKEVLKGYSNFCRIRLMVVGWSNWFYPNKINLISMKKNKNKKKKQLKIIKFSTPNKIYWGRKLHQDIPPRQFVISFFHIICILFIFVCFVQTIEISLQEMWNDILHSLSALPDTMQMYQCHQCFKSGTWNFFISLNT